MNQDVLFYLVLIGALVIWTFVRNSGSGGLRITLAEAKKRLDTENGIILLDVRTRDEYSRRHIPNSILIPIDVLESEAGKKLTDKNAEIFVYCAGGSRSSRAVKTLAKLGYKRVYNLGGIASWPYETVSGNR